MSETGRNGSDIEKALGWHGEVGIGGWGDENPRVVNKSRREFMKSSAFIIGGAALASSGLGGEASAHTPDESVVATVSEVNEIGPGMEAINSYEYDVMMSELKNVSRDLIGNLNYEYLESMKERGIDGFSEISQKIQESWAWKLGYGKEGEYQREVGLDGVWYAMLEGEMTHDNLMELYVENVTRAYWAGEIVKSNRNQVGKLGDSDKTEEFNKQWGKGDEDYRQVVNFDGKVDIEQDANWDKRKYKTVRAIALGLANNPLDVEICRRSGGARLNEMMGMVVTEAESSKRDKWVWNQDTMMFEITEGEKTKLVVDNAIGAVHGKSQELLVGIEDEILGMQEIRDNRRLGHGAWERFVKSDGYIEDKAGALGLADGLVGFVEEELRSQGVLGQEESLIKDNSVQEVVTDYADYYFSDEDRNKPSYKNMVELIRLMSGVKDVSKQVEEVKQGFQNTVPKGEEEFFQNWPKDKNGEIDWRRVDFALVQAIVGGYLYQKGPIEDYDERKKYNNMMPMRAFLANCLVGSKFFGQFETRRFDESGNSVTESSEWRKVIKKSLDVLVNTKTEVPWFEKDEEGQWQTDFGDRAFGNIHTDGRSGEPLPSELYGQLVQMEKDEYD